MERLFFGNKGEELKKKAQDTIAEAEELSDEALDQVSGAGNPFEDIPRVPTNPIDDELRKKG